MSGKQKTRKSVAKRVKVKKTGDVYRERAAHNHRLIPKSKRSKGLAKKSYKISASDVKNVKKAI